MNFPEDKLVDKPVIQPVTELAAGEVVVGQLEGLSDAGEPLVNFPQNLADDAIPAMSTMPVNTDHTGRQVALLFTRGDLRSPLIIGLIHSPLQSLIDGFQVEKASDEIDQQSTSETKCINQDADINATIDGNRVVLEGREEVVLKCGEASITLTKAGKILIRGKYILNRSTGVNRILGGSVQVN